MMRNADAAINVAVGARLRAMRERRKLTQGAVGDLIGVTLQMVHRYESGAATLSVPMLLRLVDALGCEPRDLLPKK